MKILILANYGIGLYKFRKELIQQLIEQKEEVYVSFPNCEYVKKFLEIGCNYIKTNVDRRGTNPVTDIKLLLTYYKIIKRIRPDLVLTYSVKPNAYGGIACQMTNTPYIATVTGMGTSLVNKSMIQKISLTLYKLGLRKASCVFFENEYNKSYFKDKKLIKENYKIVPGAGVNLCQHNFEEYPEDDGNLRLLYIGRIMKDKGIDELLAAAVEVKNKYQKVQFDFIGFYDDENDYYKKQFARLEEQGIIKFHGMQEDVHPFINRAHGIVLPSYHEGTSNALLEAASTGRPLLASLVPGCMETFDEGISGMGFEARNKESLTNAIMKFIELPYEQKRKMGRASRNKMEKEYDRTIVVQEYMKVIDCLRK